MVWNGRAAAPAAAARRTGGLEPAQALQSGAPAPPQGGAAGGRTPPAAPPAVAGPPTLLLPPDGGGVAAAAVQHFVRAAGLDGTVLRGTAGGADVQLRLNGVTVCGMGPACRALAAAYPETAGPLYPLSSPMLMALVDEATERAGAVAAAAEAVVAAAEGADTTAAPPEQLTLLRRTWRYLTTPTGAPVGLVATLHKLRAALQAMEERYFDVEGGWVCTAQAPSLADCVLAAALDAMREKGVDAAALGCRRCAAAYQRARGTSALRAAPGRPGVAPLPSELKRPAEIAALRSARTVMRTALDTVMADAGIVGAP